MSDKLDLKMEEYLNGTLESAEAIELEKAIKDDPNINKVYQEHLLAQQALERLEEQDLLDMMKSIDQDRATRQDASLPKNGKTNTSYSKYWWIASILSGLLIISLVFMNRIKEVNNSLVAMNYSVGLQNENTRNINRSDEERLLYQNEYGDPMRNGIDFLEKNNFKAAIDEFSKISETSDIYRENKEWMLALTYFAESGKDHPEFKKTHEQILRNPKHQAYKKAVLLDEKIHGFWGYFR